MASWLRVGPWQFRPTWLVRFRPIATVQVRASSALIITSDYVGGGVAEIGELEHLTHGHTRCGLSRSGVSPGRQRVLLPQRIAPPVLAYRIKDPPGCAGRFDPLPGRHLAPLFLRAGRRPATAVFFRPFASRACGARGQKEDGIGGVAPHLGCWLVCRKAHSRFETCALHANRFECFNRSSSDLVSSLPSSGGEHGRPNLGAHDVQVGAGGPCPGWLVRAQSHH